MQEELGWVDSSTYLPYLSTSTLQRALKDIGIMKFRAKRQPKINAATATKRLKYAREGRTFNWKQCTVVRSSYSDPEYRIFEIVGGIGPWSWQCPKGLRDDGLCI
jgi:hypothetical protein